MLRQRDHYDPDSLTKEEQKYAQMAFKRRDAKNPLTTVQEDLESHEKSLDSD